MTTERPLSAASEQLRYDHQQVLCEMTDLTLRKALRAIEADARASAQAEAERNFDEALADHSEMPVHHYTLDQCRAALASTPAEGQE